MYLCVEVREKLLIYSLLTWCGFEYQTEVGRLRDKDLSHRAQVLKFQTEFITLIKFPKRQMFHPEYFCFWHRFDPSA